MRLTELPGTAPSDECGLMLHVSLSTTLPGGCSTVMSALVNARSSTVSTRFGFAQSGARNRGRRRRRRDVERRGAVLELRFGNHLGSGHRDRRRVLAR